MATNTTNYNLVKPSENEYYDINISNSNLDIIDTVIKKINDKLNSVSTDAKSTSFDNSDNGMSATNVQDAIVENKTSISSLNSKTDATNSNLNNLQTRVNNGQNVKMTEDNGVCRGIPNNNANDINTTGFFMGQNVTNAPTTGWIYLESKVHDNLYQNQIATDLHNSEKRWTRHKTGGTWSEWREL